MNTDKVTKEAQAEADKIQKYIDTGLDEREASLMNTTNQNILKASRRLQDARELYPPTHLEIAKRKLTLDLLMKAEDDKITEAMHSKH